MKRVSSLGGQISLMIPDEWMEEDEGKNRAFFTPRENAGTLWLEVIHGEKDTGTDDPKKLLDEITGKQAKEITKLANGMWTASWDSESIDQGVAIMMRTWSLIQTQNKKMVLAMFTFTVAKSHFEDPANVADLKMVDQSIRTCEFNFQALPNESEKNKFLGLFRRAKK